MSYQRISMVICLCLILVSALSVSAGIPPYVNIQGVLTDDVGTPLNGDYDLVFCMYEFSVGGNPLWCSDDPVVTTVTNGLFNHLLGSTWPMADSLVNYDSLFVGITVGISGELIPRTPLVTVAYAMKAQRADEGGGWAQGESVVYLLDDTDSVGIGTDTPEAKLDVQGSLRVGDGTADSDVNFYGNDPDKHFFWDASKLALRFGEERSANPWDDAEIGKYSFGAGYATTASGENSAAIGTYATATGTHAFSLGFSSSAEGHHSTAIGANAEARGSYSTAIGPDTKAVGERAFVLGSGLAYTRELANPYDNSLMIGFNDTLHTMFLDGDSVNINGSLSVSGDEYSDVNFYGGSPEYRFFWDASKGALRVGLERPSPLAWNDENVGLYSFATGYGNIARGQGSVCLGGYGTATGQYSLAAGFSSEATGQYSVAIGVDNEASANSAVAIGQWVIASAQNAFVLGKGTAGLDPLINNIENSLMVGFSDSLVSLFVEGGAVGVGTSAPEDMLHVKNSLDGGRAFVWIEADHATGWNETGIRIETPQNRWHFRMDDHSNNQIPDGALSLRSQDLGAEVMTWEDGGQIGIGVTSPGYKLDVAGSVHATSFPTSSDERFKENVTGLSGVLAKLQRVRGVTFEWNDRYAALGRSTAHKEIGVIAQEIEQVFPELVTTWGDDEYRAVDYGRLSAVLIEAVKELKSENDELKARIEALENNR